MNLTNFLTQLLATKTEFKFGINHLGDIRTIDEYEFQNGDQKFTAHLCPIQAIHRFKFKTNSCSIHLDAAKLSLPFTIYMDIIIASDFRGSKDTRKQLLDTLELKGG